MMSNRIKLNALESSTMLIGTSQKVNNKSFSVKINNDEITSVTSTKCLGVLIDIEICLGVVMLIVFS